MIIKLIQSDVFDWLATAEKDSVDCVVTSPPYWQQRDYHLDPQIGQECTLSEYLETLTKFARQLYPICKRSSTFWMVIGDKFVGGRQMCIPHKLIDLFHPWVLIHVVRRFTPAYEHILFFVKSHHKYYFKQVVEPATYAGATRGGKIYNTRNKRDVWTVKPVSIMGHEAPSVHCQRLSPRRHGP